MYDSVLVPVDDTAETTRLLERAIRLAETWDAAIHVVGVVDGPTALNAEHNGWDDRVAGARERARRATMRAEERVERAALESTSSVRRGVPHAEIVAASSTVGADLVLLGPPSRETTDGPICSGQVTRRVVERSECSVLVEQLGDELPPQTGSNEAETQTEFETESDRRVALAGAQ